METENKFYENMHDAAIYICKMVRKNCELNEDLEVLIENFIIFSWVFEKLKKQGTHPRILQQMKKSCVATISYLWDKLDESIMGR